MPEAARLPRSLDGPLSPCPSRRCPEQQFEEPPLGQPPTENIADNRNNNLGFRVGSTLSAGAGAITVAPGAH
jgi:hypothetical protein